MMFPRFARHGRAIVWLAAALLGSLGCAGHPAAAAADDDAAVDAASADGADLAADATTVIAIAATQGQLALKFSVNIVGKGSKFIGDINISPGAATVEMGGDILPAVVHERQPFGVWTLYQTLAVASNRLYVLWFYCQNGKLGDVYYEGTDGTVMTSVPGAGTCTETLEDATVNVQLPTITMDQPPLVDGFTLTGPQVALSGAAPGTLTLGSTVYTALVFGQVDCTQTCGTPGWRELHTLLWDKVANRLCFAIFYLFDPPKPLQVTYSLTLPDLSDPAGNTILGGSSWSMP